ncbi:MAG: GNAT family N-acetyltransferase, partial [Thiohalocapsa sp.]
SAGRGSYQPLAVFDACVSPVDRIGKSMLNLRDYRKTDAGRLVELANNERVSRYLIDTFPHPYRLQNAEGWISTGCREPGTITKVIELDGCFVGSIGLTLQSGWRSHLAEVGYWLGEPYWGQGLASTALARMSEHAFAELGCHKLFAPVMAPNRASMRVLLKSGFRLVGIMADEVAKQGRFYDVHHFERLSASAERPAL